LRPPGTQALPNLVEDVARAGRQLARGDASVDRFLYHRETQRTRAGCRPADQRFHLDLRDRGIGARQGMQTVLARVGRRREHGDHRLEVGLAADEPDVIGIAHGAGLRPLHGQGVEFTGLVLERVLPQHRGVEPGNGNDAVLQAVTEHRFGTPQRVHQLWPPRPDEPHRDRKPGLVKRGDGAGEHLRSAGQRR